MKSQTMKQTESIYGRGLPNNMPNASEGVITMLGNAFFNPLSPESILQPNFMDKATYGASFAWGAADTASFALSSNAAKGIISTRFLMNPNTLKISSLGSFEREVSLPRLLSSSEYIYCVEMNSNLPSISFSSKIKREFPLVTNAENTTLKSTTKIMFYELFARTEAINLFDKDRPTSSANSFACFSVSFDLETIDSIFFISDNFFLNSSFRNLENNNCH